MTVLKSLADAEQCDAVWWVADGDEICFIVNCNDIFYWGTSDAEEITEENLSRFVETLKEAEDTEWWAWGPIVWVARERKERPQGAYLKDLPPEVQEVFRQCGPEREKNMLNPVKFA